LVISCCISVVHRSLSAGVITSVAIQCQPISPAQNVCLLSVVDYETALEVYRETKSSLGEIVSAFEFMDSVSFNTSLKAFKDIRNPLASSSAGTYLLVETLGSNDDHDKEKISALLNVPLLNTGSPLLPSLYRLPGSDGQGIGDGRSNGAGLQPSEGDLEHPGANP